MPERKELTIQNAISNFERRRFYRRVCTESKAYENRTSYTIACPDGAGIVTCLQVFPGVELALNDFHAFHCLECYDGGDPFQLDFCSAGRFECAFSPGEHCILAPGDLAIHQSVERGDTEAAFPLGYYQGVNLTIDCALANEYAVRHFGVLAPDFTALQSRLLSGHWFWVQRAAPQCAAIFRELAASEMELAPEMLQLKLLELLWFLEHMPLEQEEFPYFPRSQIELAKRVRQQLIDAPDRYTSVEQLSREYQISVSQLQKVFKRLYGVPVYQYVREWRLEQAAKALRETSKPVTEIALDAGYANPGKFAGSFKERYGLTPLQYRKAKKWNIEMEQLC